jgi:hypothetical protein
VMCFGAQAVVAGSSLVRAAPSSSSTKEPKTH